MSLFKKFKREQALGGQDFHLSTEINTRNSLFRLQPFSITRMNAKLNLTSLAARLGSRIVYFPTNSSPLQLAPTAIFAPVMAHLSLPILISSRLPSV